LKNRENNKFDIRKKPVAVSVASVPRQQTVMQPGGFLLKRRGCLWHAGCFDANPHQPDRQENAPSQ